MNLCEALKPSWRASGIRYSRHVVPTALHERLVVAVGDRTFRHIGELTKTHPETVRRYMGGQAPSTDFLAALCTTLSLNADWLLTGRGVMRLDEQRSQALREAT